MIFFFGLEKRPRAMAGVMALCCALVAVTSGAGWARGQEQVPNFLDPHEVWYRGFLLVQESEELEENGKHLEALNKLAEAKPLFDHLAQKFPHYQSEIVKGRRHLIAEKQEELRGIMSAPSFRRAPPVIRAEPVIPPFASQTPQDESSEIDYSSQEFALPSWNHGPSQALPRQVSGGPGSGMPRIQSRPRAGVGAVAGSIHQELKRRDSLRQQSNDLVKQKDSLIRLLNEDNAKLRKELASSQVRLESAQQEVTQARNKVLGLERQIAKAEGSQGAQSQGEAKVLRGLLREAMSALQDSTERNAQLVAALDQSQKKVKKLEGRMKELERERDQLAEALQEGGNGGEALKDLMVRNKQLIEQLDRAEQLATSLSELSKEKDEDITMLKSQIGRIKSERDHLFAKNEQHQKNIEDLERKLEMLSDGLSEQDKDALASSPVERQENELLRSMVLKQLRRQAQMKQAKALLLSQLEKVGSRSETLLGLVEDMATGTQLTEEEKALFKSPQFQEIVEAAQPDQPLEPVADSADSEVGPGSANSVSVTLIAPAGGKAKSDDVVRDQKLTVELSQIEKAARLDFSEGRYSEAESGFLEYLRYRPRNVACLCNLGILKISMKNYSEAEHYLEKAIAINNDSGLAHYLLGRTLFLQDRFEDALEKLERGLTLDPKNAKAHNIVGVISSRKGWFVRAERAFSSAVKISPKYADAHFNLAVLYMTREKPDPKATEKHYFEALKLGVQRDGNVEEFLKQAEVDPNLLGMAG